MQLRNAKTAATASTSSTEMQLRNAKTTSTARYAAQIDSPQNPDTDSDSEPKNVYWTQSNSRQSKIFDEYFEKSQYPSKIEMEQLAEKACVSLQCVQSNFYNRRKRAHKMVARGARKELPTQMKQLKKVVYDKSVKYWSQSKLCQFEIFDKFFENIQFPSKAELEQLAEQTGVSIECVRNSFTTRRMRARKMVASGERKELPHQMKALHETYLEKKHITPKELKQLSRKLNIEPNSVLAFFKTSQRNERRDGGKGTAKKNVPRLNFRQCKKHEDDSEDETDDEEEEEMEDSSGNRKTSSKSRHRSEDDGQYSDDEGDDISEDSEDEDDQDADKSSQPCSSSSVSRNSRTATRSKQRIDESSDDDNEPPRKKRAADRRQMGRIRENEEEFDEMAEDWELPLSNRRLGRCRDQTPDYEYNPPSPVSSHERDHASQTTKGRSRSSLVSRRIEEEEDSVPPRSPMPHRSSVPNGRLQRQLSAPRFRLPHPSRRGQTRRWRSRMAQAVESYSKKLIEQQLSTFMRNFQQDPGSSSSLNSRRQNREATHKSRKRVEEDESEDEDSEDGDSLARIQKPVSKSRQGIEEEENESSDDDNEPPRKKRPVGRRQIGRIREHEEEFDEMAEDWELRSSIRRLGKSRGQTRDINYDQTSPVTRGVSRPSFSRRRDQEGSRESSRYVSSMETNEWLRDVLSGLSETRVEIHGRKFKDVVLPYNHSVDWEKWSSAQTVQVATQLFPPRAVEFFKKSGVHSRVLYMFIDGLEGTYEGLEDHNEDGHFTREMFDAFGDNIRKINELMKEKAAETSSSSRSGYVETSASNGTFKAPSRPAPCNLPVSQNPTGPMRNWTDEQCLQLARQFVPKKTLAVFKEWGLGRQKLLKIAEKDEESFERLRTLDVELNDKETLSWRMFDEFGEYIRGMQVMEWKLRESSSSSSTASSSSSSPDEVFKAPSSSAPETPPSYALHTTLVGLPGQKQKCPKFLQERRCYICGPEFKDIPLPFNFSYVVDQWTDAHFLEFASQFVPKESLAVLKKWGLTRSTVSGFTAKNERSFRKLKDLDMKINKKETFTRQMFEQFGFDIREIQKVEQKRRREDLPRSRTSSIMSDSLNFWKSKDRCTPPRRDEFKEEVMEPEEEEEERAPATVLFTPRRSRK